MGAGLPWFGCLTKHRLKIAAAQPRSAEVPVRFAPLQIGSKMLPTASRNERRVITGGFFVGMPVKLSDELVESAREEAANTDRSITGQIEHWAKIGRSVEIVLRHQELQTLKRSPLKAQLPSGTRHAIQAVLERLVAEDDRRALARRLRTGR